MHNRSSGYQLTLMFESLATKSFFCTKEQVYSQFLHPTHMDGSMVTIFIGYHFLNIILEINAP
jgi:hypothetical protein